MAVEKFDLEKQKKIFDYNLTKFEDEVSQDGLQEVIVSFLVYSSYYSHSKEKGEIERKNMFNKKELEVLTKIEKLLLSIEYDGFSLEVEDGKLFEKYREEFWESGVRPQEPDDQ